MATYTKLPLSGSVNGKQILIGSVTGSSATPIHTTLSGTGSLDEVYIYACNNTTSSISLTIQWGGIVYPNDIVTAPIPLQSGRVLLVDGKLLQNALTISAYAEVANVIVVDGFINRIQ